MTDLMPERLHDAVIDHAASLSAVIFTLCGENKSDLREAVRCAMARGDAEVAFELMDTPRLGNLQTNREARAFLIDCCRRWLKKLEAHGGA